MNLKKLNLERELLQQYESMSKLFNLVYLDTEIPVGQKASLANSVASLLQQIAKLQDEIYASERVKKIESIIIKTLQQTGDVGLTARFLENYEKNLNETFTP